MNLEEMYKFDKYATRATESSTHKVAPVRAASKIDGNKNPQHGQPGHVCNCDQFAEEKDEPEKTGSL